MLINDNSYLSSRMHRLCDAIAYVGAVTAGGKGYLRTLSLAKLKNYMQSYGMRLGPDVLEKEDVIDAVINARVSFMRSLPFLFTRLNHPCLKGSQWLSSDPKRELL